MSLRDRLTSGSFAVTAEISPPRGASIDPVAATAALLRDWVDAYDRAASQGRAVDLRLLLRPIDHRRWGQSSWLNYWQGRDDDLWTGDSGARPGASP